LNFGPYTEVGQNPNTGSFITETQIRELLGISKHYTGWARTFSTTGGLEVVGRMAHEMGMKAAIGCWLSGDLNANEEQIAGMITIGQAGEADMLIVGSEVLLRGDLSDAKLIGYIERVRAACPGILVATADVYGELLAHPNVIAACDIIMPNFYPYWEGIKVDYAVYHVHLRYREVVAAAGGKPVIVSESGWPSAGSAIGEAVASSENAALFFLNFVSWAKAEDVDYFYFEAFDEPWKAANEGSQGAHWGIFDTEDVLKPGMERAFAGETIPNNWGGEILDGPGTPTIEFSYVPSYGSFDDLRGRASHVRALDYRVAVYAKVGGGWWTKPYWDYPLTLITPDGTWACDITTGGSDQNATEIIAFLVSAGYDPPSMSGGDILPQGLYDSAVDWIAGVRSP
jgi:exo-beta-1,3-glucanase (GH17 family)